MRRLARSASARYPRGDRFARHFAYGKLKGDPVFGYLLRAGVVPEGARLLDLGCGQGLVAAWLQAAREAHAKGEWPSGWPPPPSAFRLRGIERSARAVQRARSAGGAEAEYVEGDIHEQAFGNADLVLLLDVLQYNDPRIQEEVLKRVRTALDGGGTLLLRVADAGGSLRFHLTEWLDHASVLLHGLRPGRLHSRPRAAWIAALESLGFAVRAAPMSEGTPFANVLLVARYDRPPTDPPPP